MVFASYEDFGIIPVEAQACGTPVISYGRGGVRETIIEGKTGLFFKDQTPESIIEAIGDFEIVCDNFKLQDMLENAKKYDKKRFQANINSFVEQKWGDFISNGKFGRNCHL